MFDLFRSRARLARYLLGAILTLVAVSMVVTLIPGFVRASYAPDNVVAEIGDEPLTTRDVQLFIAQQLRNNAFPREMLPVYVPIIVNQMIAERALAYQAQRLGFVVTDQEVASTVQSLLPELFPGGKFAGKDAYQQYLARMNLTIPEFESNVRKQILLMRLMNLTLEGELVTQEEVERVYRQRNEKIKLDYISLGVADLRNQVQVTPEELRQHFEQNRSLYRIPEKRDAAILTLAASDVEKQIQVSDAELLRAYRSQQERFRVPERVRARHILLKTTGRSEQERKQLRAKAEELLKQLKAGANFAELAKKHSEDAGTAPNGGDIGWIARGQTVPNFERVAFSLKPGEISSVIETEYGYHIVQVLEKEQARLRPFEEVKAELAAEVRKQRVYDLMEQIVEQARAELSRRPSAIDEVAQKFGLRVARVNQVAAGDPIPEAKGQPELLEAIRTSPAGTVTPPVQLGQNELAFATVTKVYPARQAEFAEVQDRVRAFLVDQKAQKLLEEKARQLEQRLKVVGNDLQKLAREFGLTVKTTPEFTRADTVENLGAGVQFSEAFNKPVGTVIGPLRAMGQVFVCKVVAKIEADPTKMDKEERFRITEQLRQARAQQRRELLQEAIMARLVEEGKVKIYQRNIDRLVALYRET